MWHNGIEWAVFSHPRIYHNISQLFSLCEHADPVTLLTSCMVGHYKYKHNFKVSLSAHIFFFFWWRAPQQMQRAHRCLEALLVFFVFPCNRAPVELNWQEKIEVLGEKKPVPVPLYLPQIPHGLTRDRTRASAVRGRRLTVWAMARPSAHIIAHHCCVCAASKARLILLHSIILIIFYGNYKCWNSCLWNFLHLSLISSS